MKTTSVLSEIQHDPNNPNNCSTCDYKDMNDDPELHCYMFKHAPDSRCMQHTGNTKPMQFFSKFGSPDLMEMILRTGFQGLR